MLRVLSGASFAILLAGCASAPQPKPQAQRSYTSPAKIVQPVPVAAVRPAAAEKPATFKARWYDRFLRHKTQ